MKIKSYNIYIIFMLGHLFYATGLFLFCFSLLRTISYSHFIDIKEWVVKFGEKIKKSPAKLDFRNEKEYNFFVSFGCLSLIDVLWFFVGLLTPNWKIFGLFLIFTFLIRFVLEKLPFPIQKIIGTTISLFKTALILVLVLNHFHWHLDIYNLIKDWVV